MKNIIKDTMMLTLITLIAGLCLGFVYEITKEPIAEAVEKAQNKAFLEVMPEAENFTETEGFSTEQAASVLAGAGLDGAEISGCFTATDASGKEVGKVINVIASEGYGGDIGFSMGIKADGSIYGISILSINETAGLGMNAKTDNEWRSQFYQGTDTTYVVSKDATGADGETVIDALSGATITSRAVTKGVNAGVCYYNSIGGSGNE